MTWLVAFGMLCSGLSASAAVIPTSSSPPKENIIIAIIITSPVKPCGRNPPCSHRLRTVACGPPLPLNSSQPPNRIIATTATTLMIANQNSISPNTLTFVRLMALIAIKKTAAETQVGISGHQNWTYFPTAVSSAIATST